MAKPVKECPKCGAVRQILWQHIDSRSCRSRQIVQMMRRHGYRDLGHLMWGKVLKWADIPYERIPAGAGSVTRNNPEAWGADQRRRLMPDLNVRHTLFWNLNDVIFVEEWAAELMEPLHTPRETSHYKSSYMTKAVLLPLVNTLAAVDSEGEEFRKALSVVLFTAGHDEMVKMIKEAGAWFLD